MTLAHIAGVPFEEWLTPLAATASSAFLALRVTIRRFYRR
jgi:hypothetical protein